MNHKPFQVIVAVLVVVLICAFIWDNNKKFDDFDVCKTVDTVGSCTRYDCRVGFTDETNGTLRGPALQGDLVCKHDFRDFWEMPKVDVK
jgi:hypothetical protein